MKQEFVKNHKNGSLWAKGFMDDGIMVGYWEWVRQDGTRMRSGSFQNGKQTGEWSTYNKTGQIVKVTNF